MGKGEQGWREPVLGSDNDEREGERHVIQQGVVGLLTSLLQPPRHLPAVGLAREVQGLHLKLSVDKMHLWVCLGPQSNFIIFFSELLWLSEVTKVAMTTDNYGDSDGWKL